jgi:hypothetical protein
VTDRAAIRTPALLSALAGILVLAIAVPFGAVTALHARRLDTADAELRRLARHLPATAPTDVAVLVGAGQLPRALDLLWRSGPASPLLVAGEAIGPDPWGNAFVVNVAAARSGGAVRVLSAGPDGVIQTPFHTPAGSAATGDDRAITIGYPAPGAGARLRVSPGAARP